MVTYQTMVGLAFDVVDEHGGEFEDREETAEFVRQLGGLWTRNKGKILQWSEARTVAFLEDRITP